MAIMGLKYKQLGDHLTWLGPLSLIKQTVGMAKDSIEISISASDYSKLRAALCSVGCGNIPNAEEAALLHELMKNLESAQGQLISGNLLKGIE